MSWPDEWITVVPLREMARVSQERQLIRTTLYLVSPHYEAVNNAPVFTP